MIFEQLNPQSCKTYLIACERTRQAMLVDPILPRVGEYAKILADRGLTLSTVLDTHVHADHLSGCAALRDLTKANYVMHEAAAASCANRKVGDGTEIAIGDVRARVVHTPGHTKDSLTLVLADRILTGDFLFLGEGGAGRTDLLGGDPGDHWDSLQKLADFPDGMLVFPGHDYHCREHSTLGEERAKNDRLRRRPRAEYVAWLAGLKMGPAPWMVDVIRANAACTRDPNAVAIPAEGNTCEVKAPPVAPGGGAVRTIRCEEVAALLGKNPRPFILDVRNPDEWVSELGRVEGARLLPLPELPARLQELRGLEAQPIITICKMGGRSAKAAAILMGAGFTNIQSMDGGMVRWSSCMLPVTRQPIPANPINRPSAS
jgi:glyoxylase-like metal-dependent hydrolase (beta-lactamase superfamily II)/rhodanese-related sulfurtransferase